jgi:hypothetical protein
MDLAKLGLTGENACVPQSLCARARFRRTRVPIAVTEGRQMQFPWLGEFLGTLVLVLLGTGVNAGVTLRKSYAADRAGW